MQIHCFPLLCNFKYGANTNTLDIHLNTVLSRKTLKFLSDPNAAQSSCNTGRPLVTEGCREQPPRGAPWVSGLVAHFVQTWPDSECSHTVQFLDGSDVN